MKSSIRRSDIMNTFQLLGYACWVGSAILIFWMLLDFFKVNAEHEEDFLLSSREGHDEITEQEKIFAAERDELESE
jgi:hypothetical protein